MKLCAALLICYPAFSQCSFYASNGGSDSNNGTSQATPWKTIAHINAHAFSPGQTVCFQDGGQWRESLKVSSSGSAGSPITFTSYGTGAQPVINGANLVSGWTLVSGSVWSATVPTHPFQVY